MHLSSGAYLELGDLGYGDGARACLGVCTGFLVVSDGWMGR